MDVTTKEPMEEFLDSVQTALDRLRRRIEEAPAPASSRAAAFAKAAGLPVQMAYTVEQTAMYTGLNKQTLYRERDAGRLRMKLPRGSEKGYRIAVDEMDRWMEGEDDE